MPRQAYWCDEDDGCGHETILYLSFDDEIPADVECEECGTPAKHVIGAVADVFVARGWNEKAGMYQGTKSEMIRVQRKHVQAEREAAEKYGDAREAHRAPRKGSVREPGGSEQRSDQPVGPSPPSRAEQAQIARMQQRARERQG